MEILDHLTLREVCPLLFIGTAALLYLGILSHL